MNSKAETAPCTADTDMAGWSGGMTVGHAAATASRSFSSSRQVPACEPVTRTRGLVDEAVRRHPLFQLAARPARIKPVMFSRYEPGMEYGNHVDDAVMSLGSGRRLTAVGWAQSQVRDPHRRELLFGLDTARRRIFDSQGKTAEFDLITKSVANLTRMWAEL